MGTGPTLITSGLYEAGWGDLLLHSVTVLQNT